MPNKVDILVARKFRLEGKTHNEIANYFGVTRQAISIALKRANDREHRELLAEVLPKVAVTQPFKAIDTRHMSWEDWAKDYLDIDLYDKQVQTLILIDTLARSKHNLPRRYGKTTKILKVFITRKLCESQFFDTDQNIIYLTAVGVLISFFTLDIEIELYMNPKIIASYGELIDRKPDEMRRTLSRNTQNIITLINRRDTFLPSFMAITLKSKFRGVGARWVLIDDPVDIYSDSGDRKSGIAIRKETRKLASTIRDRLLPMVKLGSLAQIGTRYDTEDIYSHSYFPHWDWFSTPAILKWGAYSFPGKITKASDIFVENIDDWDILAQFLWENNPTDPNASAIQNILFQLYDMGDKQFSTELLNDPKKLNPEIDYTWYQSFKQLSEPNSVYNWSAFVDVAVSEKEGGDYTAVVLMANLRDNYYWYDHFYKQLAAKAKYDRIEEEVQAWEQELGVRIPVYVETVLNQRETYQYLRDETTLTVKEANPKSRGNKFFRIMNGLAIDLQKGKIWLREGCRFKHQLEKECDGFPDSGDDHLLDAGDQVHHFLKKFAQHRIRSPKGKQFQVISERKKKYGV